MILLTATTDKLSAITSSAANVDIHVSYVDASTAVPPVVQGSLGRKNTQFSSATTTDISGSPAANMVRNVKTINVRNKHASTACDVTVQFDQNGTLIELFKATLAAGEEMSYVEGAGWYAYQGTAKMNSALMVAGDAVNATTSFADITGLTKAIVSGHKYLFESGLFVVTASTANGHSFGFNGPASPTTAWIAQAGATTPGIASTNITYGVQTAYNTAIAAATTGPGATNSFIHLNGFIQPSADGTFALRFASETAVASGVTVKTGSWLQVREID